MTHFFVKIALFFCVFLNLVVPGQAAKQVLYVDSYHKGYHWSDGITRGIQSVLNGEDVILRIYRMDTKRNSSEEFKKGAAISAKKMIAEIKPDIVIASDDNASKYLIMPFFKDANLPFVFCGVNYSGDAYGYPYRNVTGMVELPPVVKLIYSLKHFTRIVRVGYLASDTLTERKDGSYAKQDVREAFIDRYVKTFSQWKAEFDRLQDRVDVLIVGNSSGIKGWDDREAQRFAEKNTRIPTGCLLDWMAPLAFLGATRIAEEQGTYAAKTALAILNGTPMSNIPIRGNAEANIIINMRIAKALKKEIPVSFLKIASKIIQ